MKRLTTTLCLTIAVLLGTPVQAETVFYCQSELGTGFMKKPNGTWETAKFKNERWTIKFSNDYKKLYGLDKNRPFNCNVPFVQTPNTIVCLSGFGLGETFSFGKVSLRFLFATPLPAGYIEGGTDTSNLYAGTCQKF